MGKEDENANLGEGEEEREDYAKNVKVEGKDRSPSTKDIGSTAGRLFANILEKACLWRLEWDLNPQPYLWVYLLELFN